MNFIKKLACESLTKVEGSFLSFGVIFSKIKTNEIFEL